MKWMATGTAMMAKPGRMPAKIRPMGNAKVGELDGGSRQDVGLWACMVRGRHPASRPMCGFPRPRMLCLGAWLATALSAFGQAPAPAQPAPGKPPLVWIFNGTPGDAEHHAFY